MQNKLVNPAIFYHPDAFRTSRNDLKGRHSAGESFLTAYLNAAKSDEVYALCASKRDAKDFADFVGEINATIKANTFGRADIARLQQQKVLHLPHPEIAEEARLRSFAGHETYAVCGITHTIASSKALKGVADLTVAPVQPYDALICTSPAVYDAFSTLLSVTEDNLRSRLGASKFTRPMMPIIPLGVHAERFRQSEKDRKRWQDELNITNETTVIIFFGRLSVHAKAAPFQLAQAAELASAKVKSPIAIIWCGWFNDEFQERVFMQTAKQMAPSVAFHHIDGRLENVRFSIWSAADIFCSLSDNLQESFGLTVIEAMAAGLPVIVSDWDGYRSTVKHGMNGILVDSYMPDVSLADAAYRYLSGLDTYDLYVGALSQVCFVDMQQVVGAIVSLATSADLRKRLGTAARETILTSFDWRTIMPRYQALWQEQADRLERSRHDERRLKVVELDPTAIFAGFPSKRLSMDRVLQSGPMFSQWEGLVREPGIVINASTLTGRSEYLTLRNLFTQKNEWSVREVTEQFREGSRPAVYRSLAWSVKIGLLQLKKEDHD